MIKMLKLLPFTLILSMICLIKPVSGQSQDSEIINSFICNTYKDFTITHKLLPVAYLEATIDIDNFSPSTYSLVRSKASSRDTVYVPVDEFLQEEVISQKEANEMIESLKKYNGSSISQIECGKLNSNPMHKEIVFTFSQPVFTLDRTKFIILVEAKNLVENEGMPTSIREMVLLGKKNNNWVKLYRIELD